MRHEIQSVQIMECISQRWSPTIGDPSPMGWTTVAAYAVAAAMSGLVFLKLRNRERAFWLFLFILLSLLAVNKQLDLQSALTAAGRCLAKLQGWYGQRRTVQLLFVVVLAAFGVSATAFLFLWMKDEIKQNWLAMVGLGVLVTFVLIRAIGFYHVDALINSQLMSVRMNWIFELSGILLISLNAGLLLVKVRPS